MGEFPDLGAFLEHVSLVMDAESDGEGERVAVMTLHAAKGLEFEVVFLPGWEEGLFPNQRALDEGGRAALEEERRLAYVGLTRARSEIKIYHAANRRLRGLWQTSLPSRFLTDLPDAHLAFEETEGAAAFGGYASRFDAASAGFSSHYDTPGWRRAEERSRGGEERTRFGAGHGRVLEGQAERRREPEAGYEKGARVFHLKIGPGSVVAVDGPKLTVDFDHAGRKLVMERFVTAEP